MPFLTMPALPGVFVDALLTDSTGTLMFLSTWGRDSASQELFARLSLEESEQGFSNSRVLFEHPSGETRETFVPDKELLDKIPGRMPAHSIFGDGLVHGLVFQTMVQQPDQANQHAILIHRPDEPYSSVEARQWNLIQAMCRVPVLTEWRDPVLQAFRNEGWVADLEGFGISGREIRLKEPEVVIRSLIQGGRLPIPGVDDPADGPSAFRSAA